MSITSNCMLVNVHMGKWGGFKKDKAVGEEVSRQKGAARDAVKVNKQLLPEDAMGDIIKAYGKVKANFYNLTLPWKDNGDRVLTRKMYAQFIEQHEALAAEYNSAADTFAFDMYPPLRAAAEFRMGMLFNVNDYPSPADLRRKFFVHMDIDPIPEAGDFRVVMDQDQVDVIQKQIEDAMQQRMNLALGDVWSRLARTLGHFQASLADEEKTFRDSTVENLKELVTILPGLNVTNDKHLSRIHKELVAAIGGVEAKDLRGPKNLGNRAGVASEAQRIMDDMAGFCRAFKAA